MKKKWVAQFISGVNSKTPALPPSGVISSTMCRVYAGPQKRSKLIEKMQQSKADRMDSREMHLVQSSIHRTPQSRHQAQCSSFQTHRNFAPYPLLLSEDRCPWWLLGHWSLQALSEYKLSLCHVRPWGSDKSMGLRVGQAWVLLVLLLSLLETQCSCR